jgi:hypothetical protein
MARSGIFDSIARARRMDVRRLARLRFAVEDALPGRWRTTQRQRVRLTVISTFAGGGGAPGAASVMADQRPGQSCLFLRPRRRSGRQCVYCRQNGQRVRKVSPDGVISTIAGSTNGQFCMSTTNACGDGGPATEALLNAPHGSPCSRRHCLHCRSRQQPHSQSESQWDYVHDSSGYTDSAGMAGLRAGAGQWAYGVAVGPDEALYCGHR